MGFGDLVDAQTLLDFRGEIEQTDQVGDGGAGQAECLARFSWFSLKRSR